MKFGVALIFLFLAQGGIAQEVSPAPPLSGVSAADEEFSKVVLFGKKFFDLEEYAAAYEQFAKADKLRPNQAAVLYNVAVILAKLGRYAEAQEATDRYNRLHPAGAEAPLISKLGFELAFQRELQKKRQAEQEYQELFNRAKFSYERGDMEAATKGFQDAEQQRPADPSVAYNQAVVAEKRADFARALERLRRYAELAPDAGNKTLIDQKIFNLETEIVDMRTKVVCSFCGHKLPVGSTWCHRCWHGPYLTGAAWNSRTCAAGASATRTMFFSDGRVSKNEDLTCLLKDGGALEEFRYNGAKQREIQAARKAEGWVYDGEVIQSWSDKDGKRIVLEQKDSLERVVFESDGSTLNYKSHRSPQGVWLLDSEQVPFDGQLYTVLYTFDDQDRIASAQVRYQNTAACNHLVTVTAEMTWDSTHLVSARIRGGYDGYSREGSPQVRWEGAAIFSYDAGGRLSKENFALESATKTYMVRPQAAIHDEIYRIYPSMRTKKPLDILKTGDLCATAGSTQLGNMVDLRALYALSPNLAIALPFGVTKVTVNMTYPENFKITEK